MTSAFTVIGQDIDDLRDRVALLETSPGSGGTGTYVHTQSTPSASWTVVHNLGISRVPFVKLDSAPGELVWVEYSIIDANTMNLLFDTAVTGSAYI